MFIHVSPNTPSFQAQVSGLFNLFLSDIFAYLCSTYHKACLKVIYTDPTLSLQMKPTVLQWPSEDPTKLSNLRTL